MRECTSFRTTRGNSWTDPRYFCQLIFWNSVVLTVLLTGCKTVGPDYWGAPNPPLPPQYLQSAVNPSIAAHVDPNLPAVSWATLDDGILCSLINRGLQNSPTVHELLWRVSEADCAVRIVSGNATPFADAFGSYEGRKSSRNAQTFVQSVNRPFEFLSIGVNSRWEIDIVGRIRRETEAAVYNRDIAVEDVADLRRVLAGNIARAYIQLRMNQDLLAQYEGIYYIQQRTMREVEARMDAGQVTKLDIVQLRSRIEYNHSMVPVYQQEIQKSYHALALLTGTTPSGLDQFLLEPKPQLSPSQATAEIPANLLRRRPDVRRAEREVASACALIGVAEADFYPRLNILGSISYNSRKISNLLDYDSLGFNVGPGVTWNILSLGRIEAQVEIQQAQLEQAIARYQQNVLLSVSEVENALVTQVRQQDRIASLLRSARDAQESVDLSIEQYQVDKVSLERVDANQRRLLQYVTDLAVARAELATAAVDLLQALGGNVDTPHLAYNGLCAPAQAFIPYPQAPISR